MLFPLRSTEKYPNGQINVTTSDIIFDIYASWVHETEMVKRLTRPTHGKEMLANSC